MKAKTCLLLLVMASLTSCWATANTSDTPPPPDTSIAESVSDLDPKATPSATVLEVSAKEVNEVKSWSQRYEDITFQIKLFFSDTTKDETCSEGIVSESCPDTEAGILPTVDTELIETKPTDNLE